MSARFITLVLMAASMVHASTVVVTAGAVDAYRRTFSGLKEQLSEVRVIDLENEKDVASSLASGGTTIAVAIGAEAAGVLDRLAPANTVVVNSIMLNCDVERAISRRHKPRTSISIDIPPVALFGHLKLLFPGMNKIGILRGPSQTDAEVNAFLQAARQAGYVVEILVCYEARDLVATFLKFKSRVDFVYCPPNAQLYTSATVKPLLISSLTSRLPVIAFSEQFVQAGALFGGAPDFEEAGRQTADIVQKIAAGEPVAAQLQCRRFRFFYNQRVARLLGVKANSSETVSEGLTVFK